jgi:hypothetical protein
MNAGSKDFRNGDSIEITTYFDQAIDIHHIFQNKTDHLLDLIEQAMEKTITDRDSDEVYAAFGGTV